MKWCICEYITRMIILLNKTQASKNQQLFITLKGPTPPCRRLRACFGYFVVCVFWSFCFCQFVLFCFVLLYYKWNSGAHRSQVRVCIVGGGMRMCVCVCVRTCVHMSVKAKGQCQMSFSIRLHHLKDKKVFYIYFNYVFILQVCIMNMYMYTCDMNMYVYMWRSEYNLHKSTLSFHCVGN